MKITDYIIKFLVLKDCMYEGTSIFQFFMMYYIYCTYILNGSSLALISGYIILPIWLYLLGPLIGLIVFGLLNMNYFLPLKQAYYMKNNREWQKFKKDLKEK